MSARTMIVICMLAGACILLTACPRPVVQETAEVQSLLSPPDERPLASIVIADANEIALLEQQLELVPIQRDGQKLVFVADSDVVERLEGLGYTVEPENPYTAYSRLVRVEGEPSEELLRQNGARVINREESHFIVEGTLASLRGLAAAGLRIAPLRGDEPRPREVRIAIPAQADVQRVADLHVDIYSVEESDRQLMIYAGAFDFQIDALRARGYSVTPINTVP